MCSYQKWLRLLEGWLPLLMYIHGGAFADGESDSHGPEFFMDENVILVTMNYRAISQSGTAHSPSGIQHPNSAKVHLQKLKKLVCCDNETSSKAMVACIRAIPWEELLDAQNKTQEWFPGLSLPFALSWSERAPRAQHFLPRIPTL